ncbi:MAG: DUF5045 domain-containing protein [Bacteroidales bacterium]|nr:DUF5045 domain-containing protein [Bacteroidales bacterium]MCD8395352.1 DUF5045 domain-containing protein [Bacteroidales bacterium]
MHSALCIAQSYAHDDTKQNQITVMELGTGNLTPELYYQLLHNSYRNSAAAKNKLGFRTTASLGAYQQVDDAEKLDSAMVKRAEIEALNVADRTGGAADLAWMAEGSKVTAKMSAFHTNINRIVPAGGTPSIRDRWLELYNCYNAAIRATQDAYMPNAQRKKEYLRIYAEILKQNENLVRYLVILNQNARTSRLLAVQPNEMPDKRDEFSAEAYQRWRAASMGGNSGSGGNGWIWVDTLIHRPGEPHVYPIEN